MQAKCLIIIYVVTFVLVAFAVWVLSGLSVVRAADLSYAKLLPGTRQSIEREQKKRLQKLERDKRSLKKLVPSHVIPPSSASKDKQCFYVHTVKFSGNTLFSRKHLLTAIKFRPACLGLSQINGYLRILSNLYGQAGYVTSRAFLVPQDLSTGILTILIMEGRLEAFKFNGKPQSFLNQAFPRMTGNVLNLRAIEQGLDQINRLSRYNAQIKLEPGSKPGLTIVDIRTVEGPLAYGSIGVDNSGQKSTGEKQLCYSLGAGNVLNLLDQWAVSGTKSTDWSNSYDSDSLSFSLDVPYGFFNFGYRSTYSSYKNTFQSNEFTYSTSGQANSHNLTLNWLFHRDAESKSSLRWDVNYRIEKNYLLGELLTSSSQKLSSVSMALTHSTRFGQGFLTLSPKITVGTDWFGAKKDTVHDTTTPRAQFYKGTLTASYSYPLTHSLLLSSTVFGQWSNDTLYGSQRLSIGGEYSVRGFKDTSISGDQGYYWRNDLTYTLGQFSYIGELSAQLAVDAGSIVKDQNDALEGGSLMGSSLSLNTRSRDVASHLSIGVPITSPGNLSADNYVVYYRLNIAI
jgi:hemolysin activation/secretion protein